MRLPLRMVLLKSATSTEREAPCLIIDGFDFAEVSLRSGELGPSRRVLMGKRLAPAPGILDGEVGFIVWWELEELC